MINPNYRIVIVSTSSQTIRWIMSILKEYKIVADNTKKDYHPKDNTLPAILIDISLKTLDDVDKHRVIHSVINLKTDSIIQVFSLVEKSEVSNG